MLAKLKFLGLLCIPILFSFKQTDTGKKTIAILFVGNSLTYSNDLPAIVKEMGQKDGVTITYQSFLFPNYALEDHWNEGKVQEEIEKGNYDFVVMQQGPSAAPESQMLLLDYVQKFAQVCEKNRSKAVVYMVWPSKARFFDLDGVINSYSNAAAKTNSLLAPAGLAWKKAWQEDEALALYSEDNFHPSVMGTVLASMTVYAVIMNKNKIEHEGYKKTSWYKGMDGKTVDLLTRAASAAITK